MLTTEPLVSIDVHNMRENPSLVPEKMVAFKNEPTRKTKNLWSKAAGRAEVNRERRSPNVVKSATVPLLNVDRGR